MKFIATVLGILLIIFGTLLIPFPDYYNFQNQSVSVDIKKHLGEEKIKAVTTQEATTEGTTEKKAETTQTKDKSGQVISVSLDPIIGAISVLIGIILVFMGRRVHS